jgi:para-nitrobenzyl esterase
MPGIGMIRMPTVFRDDALIPSGAPLDQLRRANGWNRVPVMLGTNRDENKIFMFASPVWVHRWLGFLPRLVEPDAYDVVASHLARTWKATGADELAMAMTASGAHDVYVYRFDWDEEPTVLGSDLGRMLGAAHGLEIPFVFGHWDLGREARRLFTADNEAGRLELSAAMMDYWTTFAKTGRPNGGGTHPEWPDWSARPEYLVLATSRAGGITRSTDVVTRASALGSIDGDPRLADPRTRCLVYHDLVAWAGLLSRAVYDEKCPGFAFEAHPWRN